MKRYLVLMLIAAVLLGGCSYIDSGTAGSIVETVDNNNSLEPSETLEVHILDVGQADATIIEIGDKVIMIDAGNNGDWEIIDEYIQQQNIQSFDLLVATHPHEDHIGSMAEVIEKYEVDEMLLPEVKYSSKTYKNMMDAAADKNIPLTYAEPGQQYSLNGAQITVLAPAGDYEELNNYSVVLKIEYQDRSIIFAGDAEAESEHEVVARWGSGLKADILRVGHHGGGTSTTAQFLKLISPEYAVISVGKDNSYGHPDSLITNRLEKYGSKILRTDRDGNIDIVIKDGEIIIDNRI